MTEVRIGVALVALMAAGPAVFTTAHTIDDEYVLSNARSTDFHRWLFAYSVECPGPDCPTAWWNAPAYRRHFIRFAPSLVLKLAAGHTGAALRGFGLAAHVADSLLVLWLLLLLGVERRGATLGAALFAAHPAGSELAATPAFLCVPIAAAFVLASLIGWARFRQQGRNGDAALCLVACALALTSYEAAVLLPLTLVIADRLLGKKTWLSLACCTLLLPYFLLRHWLHARDLARPFGALLIEGLRLGVAECVGYLVQLASLSSWRSMRPTWLHELAGELGATLIAAAALVLVIRRVRGQPPARLGLLLFAAFLLPPVAVRALVGVFNSPTWRQLYLPLVGAALVAGASLASRRARLGGWCAVAFFIACSWRLDAVIERGDGAAFSAAVARELRDVDPAVPVAWIGQPARYHVNFDWPERQQELLIPPPLDDGELRLCRGILPHRLIAVAPAGFFGRSRPALRGDFPSVDLLQAIWSGPQVGLQSLRFGSVEIHGGELRFTLNREVVFLRSRKGTVARVRPEPCYGGSSK